MRILASGLILASAAGLAACGGKVIVDGGGTAGAGGASASASSSASTVTSTSASSSTSTSASTSTGAGGGCPSPFPGIEAPCDQEGQSCQVPHACCGGSAVCKGGLWTFEGAFCNSLCGPDCGPDEFVCAPASVCVTFLGKITTYQCAESTCPEGGLACGCAAPLCAAEGLICNNIQDETKVLCDCNGDC